MEPKIHKKFKNYLNQLLFMGLLGVISGSFFVYILFKTANPLDWLIFYFPIKLLAAVIAYILVTYITPGGNINFYFTVHKDTQKEKEFSALISESKSKFLIFFVPLLYIMGDIIFGRAYYHTGKINLSGSVFFFLFPLLVITALSTGIKYLSAWWNIKRNKKI